MGAPNLVLIGNFAPDRQESMQRFAQVLREGFSQRGWSVQTWAPEPRLARLTPQYRYGGLPKYLGYIDKFVLFPQRVRRLKRRAPPGTAYHIVDHGNAVYAPLFDDRPLTVTCHDLLQIRSALGEFPQNPVSPSGQKYQRWILSHLARLRTVVCVSYKTRDDLCRLTPRSPQSATVIHMGLNYPYSPMPHGQAATLVAGLLGPEVSGAPFWIGIGGAQWYKNRAGTLAIFAQLRKSRVGPERLVFVGPPWTEEEKQILAREQFQDRVTHLQGVSNEGLRALYSVGTGLIFPSWEEGFGWPIAEAQACGCPVFTSNRAPMTEVGGEAACYIDPADPTAAAAIIEAELPDLEKRRDLSLRSAVRWNTARMLDEYEQQYIARVQDSPGVAAVSS